ncbi:MAG: GNAT family N-acetyltransferase, partial [Rhodospirillales bacterium]|nr:GNAT family N-acetyltransferase [Rhodospirillales bacterium]
MDATDGAPRERRIAPDDSEAVSALSVEAGWNQNVADWRFMLEHGAAFGALDAADRWIGSALALPLGPRLSWIGMVLVTRARRRDGLGTLLLRRCVEHVSASGAVAGLDATDLGRPLYLTMGFHDLYRLSRWRVDRVPPAPPSPPGVELRPMRSADLDTVAAFDAPRSAMERGYMLRHLRGRRPALAWVARRGGAVVGYVTGRGGLGPSSVGPVVADGEDIAIALMAKAMSAASGPFLLDSPDAHTGVAKWLAGAGNTAPRY